jgi:hypothetical protein
VTSTPSRTTSAPSARAAGPRRAALPGGWAEWLAAAALLAVAVLALVRPAAGPHLLVAAAGVAALVRGALLVRAADVVLGGARAVGVATGLAGAGAVAVAAVPGPPAGRVLVVGVPLLLLLGGAGLLSSEGTARRVGQLLVGAALVVAAVLGAVAAASGWAAAAGLATGVGALVAALLAVPLGGRALAARTAAAAPAPARPAACAGCACGSGGGCSALGG